MARTSFMQGMLLGLLSTAALGACGGPQGHARSGPPRMPTEAPEIGSAGSASNAALPAADQDLAARLDRLESELKELRGQFRSSEPAINRLVRIEGDIRNLVTQMERVVAARAQEGGPSRPSQPASGDADRQVVAPVQTAAAAPKANPPAGPAAPLKPLAAAPEPQSRPAEVPRLTLSLDKPQPPAAGLPAAAAQPAPVEPPKTSPASNAPAAPNVSAAAVHLASYRSLKQLREGWATLKRQFPADLEPLGASAATVGNNGRTPILRLQAGSLSWEQAKALCERLTRRGQYCVPTKDDGEALDPGPGGTTPGMAAPTS